MSYLFPCFPVKKNPLSAIITLLIIVFSGSIHAKEPARLLRFADIHQDQVVFVYSGDIYIADINTGQSSRLTSHHGFETFPKFSHSGKWIAFSAEYSGNRQVYIMKTDGSDLKQLTYYNDVGSMPPRGGFDYRVLDWSADDKQVLVRANRLPWGKRMGRPIWIPIDSGLAKPLAVPESGGGMLSPDGKKYLYTPIDREFRTWKRYRGGRAQDVWIYDLKANKSQQLTSHRATDHQPVWVGEHIYFLSDRNHTLNLYRYAKDSEPVQVTHHKHFDSLWASAGPNAIVYENNGYLWRFDPKTNQSNQLNIHIEGIHEYTLPYYKNVSPYIESMDISPNGKRAVVAARGEVFTIPAKKGMIRNISKTSGEREISVVWSPDGKQLAYLSDKTGEYELYLQNELGKAKQITFGGKIWKFPPKWSPDSKKLAFSDKNQTLWIIDIKSGRKIKADRSSRNDITEYTWSPDSDWVMYTKTEDNGYNSIWSYHLKSKKARQLTQKNTDDWSPVFSKDGHYLFFLSNRNYHLSFSSYEFNYLFHKATRIYAMQLSKTAPPLYPYQSDEALPSATKKKEDKNKSLSIDFKNCHHRIIALSAPSGNYEQLSVNGTSLFFINNYEDKKELQFLSLKKNQSPNTLVESITNYVLSANGEKILVTNGTQLSILNTTSKQNFNNGMLKLNDLTIKITPKEEWQQLYVDGWRTLRDWFYDPNTHGMNWSAIKKKYQPWVKAIHHRSDLDYIFNEIAGELNAGHIYVNRGDEPAVERKNNGLLGAEFIKDASGYFKITKIFPGENWHASLRSPLTESEVNANVGDYIIAIDGVSTKTTHNIYALLEHKAHRYVSLTLSKRPNNKNTRKVSVKPIHQETQLRYLDWLNSRMEIVNRLSNGRIGYIHLPNTHIPGNQALFKQFLPQITKDALIIDDRYNGGGFIPDRMIELLSRKTLNYWKYRGLKPQATPLIAHDGPKAMLINGYSSSGGDALPYYFKKLGLGTLIGTRTWGGLIGVSGNPKLADGGQLVAATFRIIDTDGNWIIENEGVEPDIEVIDRPELIAKGKDPSLERAVKELMKNLKQNPRKSIKAPKAPTKF